MYIIEILDYLGKEAMVQIISSFIGVGGALWIFYLTNKDARRKADDDKIRFENDKLRYIYHLMTGSQKFAEQFKNGLKVFINEFETTPLIIPLLSKPITYTVGRLVDKINQEEHFHAYRNRIPYGSKITAIFDNIDFLDSLFKNIEEQYREISMRHSEKSLEFSSLLNKCTVLMLYDREKLIKNQTKESQKLLTIYEEMNKGFLKVNKSSNFKLIQDSFVTPLSKSLFNYQKLTKDASYNETFELLIAASQTSFSMEINNKKVIENMKDDLKNLTEVYYELIQNMQSIEAYMLRIGS